MARQLRRLPLPLQLLVHERGECLRRVNRRYRHAERLDFAFERGRVDDLVELSVEVIDDWPWRIGRCSQPNESGVMEPRIPEVLHGRDFGPACNPMRTRHRQCARKPAVGKRTRIWIEHKAALHTSFAATAAAAGADPRY